MPIKKKEFELDDGTKLWFRQASGMERLKIEKVQAKVFRECRHYGPDPLQWSEEQHLEFAEKLDENGAAIEDQILHWVPPACLTEGFDINKLTNIELREILSFVRGDEDEGSVPLED